MTAVWYTSDLHVGHAMVARLRGFGDDIAAHDAMLAENWAASVSKRDVVYVLGDLSLQNPNRVLPWFAALPGRKHLIAGNHDPVHPMHRDSFKWQHIYLEVFESVQAFGRRKFAGRNILLSHFPYDGDHTLENRHMQWRLRDEGELLLHGHAHSASRGGDREVHVGVDAWGLAPVNEADAVALFKSA